VNSSPQGKPGRPYWLLLAFAVLMAAPSGVAVPALIAATVAVTALRIGRAAIARRAGSRDLQARPKAILLGTDRGAKDVVLSDHQLSAHGLILGASGSGKSTTLLRILTEHIRRGSPVVALDLKGSPTFARVLEQAAAAAGRPFRLWTPDGPSQWNPLGHGNATELKDKLIGTERFTEPHYQRAAERYVQTVLQVLQHAHTDRAPALEDVVRLMDPRRMTGMLRHVPRPLAARVQDYVAGLTPDQLSAIRGLGTRLAVITESHIGPYLAPDVRAAERPQAIDLRAALAGPEVVLFSLNSSSYGKLAAQIGTLVIQDLVSAAGDRLRAQSDAAPLRQAILGIDEFSALGGDQVIALLARGRESGISDLVATQELADLDRAAPGLRDQIVGNTAIKIVHRQDVPASAQTVAQMAGTEKVWEETHQIGGRWLRGYDNGRGTRREVERFVVHPNDIKTLRTGEAVVIAKLPETSVRILRVTPPQARGPAAAPVPGNRDPNRTARGPGSRATDRPGAPRERGGPELG
jgi:conjugal transfer pilus assembly protein TraD